MFKKVNERLGDSKGQSMLEYILIVVFVVVVGLGVWKAFGEKIKGLVSDSTSAISTQTDDILHPKKP